MIIKLVKTASLPGSKCGVSVWHPNEGHLLPPMRHYWRVLVDGRVVDSRFTREGARRTIRKLKKGERDGEKEKAKG